MEKIKSTEMTQTFCSSDLYMIKQGASGFILFISGHRRNSEHGQKNKSDCGFNFFLRFISKKLYRQKIAERIAYRPAKKVAILPKRIDQIYATI